MEMEHEVPFVSTSSWTTYNRGLAMFPGAAIAPGRGMVLTFCTTPDGLPGGKIYLMRSSDDGRSWRSLKLIASSSEANGAALCAIGITTLSNGTLVLPYFDVRLEGGYNERRVRLYILQSTDSGITWEAPVQIATDIYEPISYGQILQLVDGTLLLPIWGRYRKGEKWRSGVLRSNNGGYSWNEYRTIASDPNACMIGPYLVSAINGFDSNGRLDPSAPFHPGYRPHSSIDGFSETSLAYLPDGKIIAIIRQQGIKGSDRLEFYQSISADGGKTWSVYKQINICGMSPCLHWSPKGRLVQAYRMREREEASNCRYGVALSWSEDYGKTWEGELILKDPNGYSYTAEYQVGYPTLVNVGNIEILAIFYSYNPNLPFRRYLAANLIREADKS